MKISIHLEKLLGTTLLFCCCIVFLATAQKKNIVIKVLDKNDQPIIGVTIVLQNLNNEKLRLSNFTDTTGLVTFIVDTKDQFLLTATSVGFKKFEKELLTLQDFYNIQLLEDAKTVGTVVISAKKPLMRQEDDKTIVDPEPLAQTST